MDGLGVTLPLHVHLVDVVGSVSLEERVVGVLWACVSSLKEDSEGGQAYDALVGVLSSDSIAAELANSKVSPCLGQSDNRSGASSKGGEAGAGPSSSQALAAL